MTIWYRLARARHPTSGEIMLRPVRIPAKPLADDDLVRAVSEKTSFSRGDVTGVLAELAATAAFHLEHGRSVVLPGIGALFPTILYTPAPTGRFHPKRHLRGVRVRFRADPRLTALMRGAQLRMPKARGFAGLSGAKTRRATRPAT